MQSHSMLKKLILYFIYTTKGHLTKIQLVKFLYLADLYSVKWEAKQLTDLNWYYYNHGPWEEEINLALSSLTDQGYISTNMQQSKEGNDYCLFEVKENLVNITGLGLPKSLCLVLDNIRREWAGSNKVKALLEYVYSTAPMNAVKEEYKPEDKKPLDLSLERSKLLEEMGV
jgi:hypothetical protein